MFIRDISKLDLMMDGTSNGNTSPRTSSNAAFAATARLCTATNAESLSAGAGGGFFRQPETNAALTAGQVELACGLLASRYFYASRVYPGIKGAGINIGLVYGPEFERAHQGNANPFDTGGVYKGIPVPLNGEQDEVLRRDRARQLILGTLVDLSKWRQQFSRYLDDYFIEPGDYTARHPRPIYPPPVNDDPNDLPVRHQENVANDDFRFCAWEVRLTDRISVVDHLERWGCDQQSHQDIKKLVRDDPDHALDDLLDISPVVIADPLDLARKLEESMQ